MKALTDPKACGSTEADKFGRPRVAAAVLGWVLVAAGAANGHKLLAVPPYGAPQTWDSLALVELELALGGWLLSGSFPKGSRAVGLVVFAAVLALNIAEVASHHRVSQGFGRVMIPPWWLIGLDALIVVVLLKVDRTPAFKLRPGWLVGLASAAVCVGLLSDRFQVGQTPIVGEFRPVSSYTRAGLNYLVYLPEGYYRSRETWPLVLFLHDAESLGQDPSLVKGAGLPKLIETGRDVPFLVLAPQSPGRGWNIETVDALLTEVVRRYRVDEERVYLAGVGTGGHASWAMAAMRPEWFAAVASVSGGGDPRLAARLKGVPMWVFHGATDRVIPVDSSRAMVKAQRQAGGDVRFTVYPDRGHDAWVTAFDDPALYTWFLSHRRARGPSHPGVQNPGRPAKHDLDDDRRPLERLVPFLQPGDLVPAGVDQCREGDVPVAH